MISIQYLAFSDDTGFATWLNSVVKKRAAVSIVSVRVQFLNIMSSLRAWRLLAPAPYVYTLFLGFGG